MFQSTHLHEVWPIDDLHKPALDGFNPHTYMRCDDFMVLNRRYEVFQSTHLHEVWLCMSSIVCKFRSFQSTHLHEVWQTSGSKRRLQCTFQSTHLHEVWPNATSMGVWKRRFQSTHLHEVWPQEADKKSSTHVSIHTPTWGVTYLRIASLLEFLFQSTHLHEVWLGKGHLSNEDDKFQSTHLHEVWPQEVRSLQQFKSFNPHTYMRCDFSSLYQIQAWLGFQSTHLHEVWLLSRR